MEGGREWEARVQVSHVKMEIPSRHAAAQHVGVCTHTHTHTTHIHIYVHTSICGTHVRERQRQREKDWEKREDGGSRLNEEVQQVHSTI